MIRAYQLDGGSIMLVGDERHPHWAIKHNFRQGGCPLRLARELEEIAVAIRDQAHQMGATQEGGW